MRRLRGVPRVSSLRPDEVHAAIAGMSTPTLAFYVMVALSTTIAAFGLLANSTAVVIGAMLVAPLMGPIFGIALGAATGDRSLLRQAALSETLGVVLAVALGAGLGLLPLRLGFGSEIISRTQPTLYDVIVALASGVAGAYAMADAKVSPALPGVAIATALVPPLTACGLCLSASQWDWALGAFLLFLANLLAIEIAAAAVFVALGMAGSRDGQAPTPGRFLHRFGFSLTLLVVVAAFMTQTLLNMIAERRLTDRLQTVLSREVMVTAGAQISEVRHERRAGTLQVTAVVLTPREFEPARVARIEETLRSHVGDRLRLMVRSLISRDVDRDGSVFISQEERSRQAEAQEQARFITEASRVLKEELQSTPGAALVDIGRHEDPGGEIVTAAVRVPEPISPVRVAAAEQALARALARPVRLVVRSILTRDADAQRYLYEVKEEPEALAGEDLKLHLRLQDALRRQLAEAVAGAVLLEFRYARRDPHLLVRAVARTPRVLLPAQVKVIEASFRRHIDPAITLVIRSTVGADVAAVGYLSDFDEAKTLPLDGVPAVDIRRATAESSPIGR
ncbi:MAG: TIGR00341 family protein [Armatimonadetes bacterium]|nr:TIGR00341 family protein [Armatimonadota bacterium]